MGSGKKIKTCTNCIVCGGKGNINRAKVGNSWYCYKHYKFINMISASKSRGTRVPSMQELEDIYDNQGMTCALCKKTMVWSNGSERKDVMTLQHDQSGDIKFLCSQCNTKHARYGDKIYKVGVNSKECTRCKHVISLDNFKKFSSGKIASQCNGCLPDAKKEYFRNNYIQKDRNVTYVVHPDYGIFYNISEAANVCNKTELTVWRQVKGISKNKTKFILADG